MTESREVFISLLGRLELEAGQNRTRAEKAVKERDAGKARLLRALAHGQQLQADKIRVMLASLSPNEGAVQDALEASDALAGALREAIMTAAVDRQPVLEVGALQMSKASASHSASLGRSDSPADSYHVCQVCGFLAEDNPPERCPICRAAAQQFDAIS